MIKIEKILHKDDITRMSSTILNDLSYCYYSPGLDLYSTTLNFTRLLNYDVSLEPENYFITGAYKMKEKNILVMTVSEMHRAAVRTVYPGTFMPDLYIKNHKDTFLLKGWSYVI